MDAKSDLAFDRAHLWHPYASATQPPPVHQVREAEGIWLTLEDGTRMIDAMSSWWCTIHGHRNRVIVEAMTRQLNTLPHVMFGGLTHAPAIALGRQLVSMLPAGLEHIFYSDSGSVAVEVAVKMAVQYQVAQGQTGRSLIGSLRGGYHGDTWKAMSLCDPVTGMHTLFGGAMAAQVFAPAPPVVFGAPWPEDPEENGLGDLARLIAARGHALAAFIVEPVVQGAGGMRFYHPHYLREAARLCREAGILVIFDEIATGFGRTGRMFGMDHCGVTPDILCLGKALTGGHITFAATIAQTHVAERICDSAPHVFMHGPTFMANPLACAAASASLGLLQSGAWQGQVARIEARLHLGLEAARALPNVRDVRVLGAIGVIELDTWADTAAAHASARESGVYLRPFGHNIYTMPPFVTPSDDVDRICAQMVRLARAQGEQ